MTGLDLRPLSLGEMLDRTFFLFRRHFLLFAGITAIPSLLTLVVALWTIFSVQSELRAITAGGADPGGTGAGGGLGSIVAAGSHVFLLTLFSFIVGLLVYVLIQGGTTFAVSELYLGRIPTILASLQQAWRKLGTLFGTVLLNALAIFGGLLLLVVPGIYVACRLLVGVPVALVESRGPGESLSRSWNLTKDFAVRSFVMYLLFSIVYFGLIVLVSIPLGLAFGLSLRNPGALGTFQTVQVILSTLVRVVVTPLILIATTIFYYDLRVRKEAFDLQFLMTNADGQPGGGNTPLNPLVS